jgi:hypothetical protein
LSNYSDYELFVPLPHTACHQQNVSYKTKESVQMIRLNPQQVQNKSVTCNLFPWKDNYFLKLFTEEGFRTFLKTNATTPEGMMLVATHYGVDDKWNSWLGQSF